MIVEGHQIRTGYGNDLLDNVKSLRRILCPMNNVFDKYKEVLGIVSKLEKECLILVALGPTAELLVYDLMKKGYQSIDIGQIDIDYWWYLLGVEKRVPIPNRCVSQLPPTEIEEVNDVEYRDSIVEQIF